MAARFSCHVITMRVGRKNQEEKKREREKWEREAGKKKGERERRTLSNS